ncbi:AAA family ATPase [Aliarcobacter butzleri]|uniref:McrB family protein n=1 Tax=Aliarcobacter butzleri TaxID=28197 RepID=UPI00263E54EB|nr:AAA family ATPase [Aliarcobacter butzleri]MDN5101837.1 AAA family ATPase [Aliarcobacter butzleri]
MTEQELINKHKEIFNFLLEYKKEHSNFVFSPRQKHNDVNNNHLMCRLCKGYIFQGNENYIFVPLYKKVDTSNHTKTIGFVYTQNEQYIEIVFNNIEGNEKTFYDEINEYLKKSDKVIVKKIHNFKFQYILNESLEKNLLYFISDVKGRIDSLIIKYGLENEYFISEKEFQDLLNKIEMNPKIIKDKEDKMKINLKTKNIMLYGAPGVGKTHNYKKLVSLIESGKYNESDIFESIIENQKLDIDIDKTFEIIKNEKRIEFVTFHQSYSYEDFIEGFRPNEEGKLELEDGIFKKISQNAEEQTNEVEKNQISYDEAYNTLRSKYIDNTNSDLKTVSGKNILISNFEDKFIQVKSEDGRNWFNVKKNDLEVVVNEILKQNIIKPSDIKLIDVKKDTIALAGYYFPIGNALAEIIKESKVNTKEQKNFYIVIDEINRGNISKIFGELITLIEEDKRGKEEYKVKLPYSKKTFVVPSNLYIIATMNSTDKSIATIDIALRRRFTFLKMEPKEELVENENAKALMNQLNEHIKETIGKDYKLGHSYFMSIKDDNDLEFVKKYKIKPLLEEYFYGDETNYNKAIKFLNEKEEGKKQ